MPATSAKTTNAMDTQRFPLLTLKAQLAQQSFKTQSFIVAPAWENGNCTPTKKPQFELLLKNSTTIFTGFCRIPVRCRDECTEIQPRNPRPPAAQYAHESASLYYYYFLIFEVPRAGTSTSYGCGSWDWEWNWELRSREIIHRRSERRRRVGRRKLGRLEVV